MNEVCGDGYDVNCFGYNLEGVFGGDEGEVEL